MKKTIIYTKLFTALLEHDLTSIIWLNFCALQLCMFHKISCIVAESLEHTDQAILQHLKLF